MSTRRRGRPQCSFLLAARLLLPRTASRLLGCKRGGSFAAFHSEAAKDWGDCKRSSHRNYSGVCWGGL